ncbi:hypothetical protein D3C85_1244580 [compost metagenome]
MVLASATFIFDTSTAAAPVFPLVCVDFPVESFPVELSGCDLDWQLANRIAPAVINVSRLYFIVIIYACKTIKSLSYFIPIVMLLIIICA